jgi:hypothetical protein
MSSVKEQILAFLQKNPGLHHGGNLQRMEFKSRTGNASPDAIKRRCNELVKEGKAFVEYQRGQALFSSKEIIKPRYRYEPTPEGTMREVVIP